jgi:nucleolar protein 15
MMKRVANVVADTMSGYLMGQKRLVCHVLPKDKIHPNLFKGSEKVFTKVDWAGIHRSIVNRPKPAEKMKEITKRLVSRERKRRQKLNELGIDYDFPGYAASNEGFPVLMDTPKQKRVLENVEGDKSEPPAKKGKVEKDEPSAKKGDAEKTEPPVKKGKVGKTEPPVKKGKVVKNEPPIKKGNVEKNEPALKKGKVEKDQPSLKKGMSERNEPLVKKGKVEKMNNQ